MHLGTLSPTSCPDWAHCLPGFKLTHTIHLVSSLSLNIVSAAAAILEVQKASVERWTITRFGDVLEQRIVLDEMTERQAVLLREQLVVLDGVLRARIEHHFVRARSAAPTHSAQTIPVA